MLLCRSTTCGRSCIKTQFWRYLTFTLTVTTFLLFGKHLLQEEAGFPAGVDSRVTAGERLGRGRPKNTNLSGKWLLCRVRDVGGNTMPRQVLHSLTFFLAFKDRELD